ncbi:G-box binding factor [Phytophthora pseudosyringae]|uniref:G-box binding factor n=1 Tax=Phytophthora pseudosyringae TaxID=221518 RepID=A0A8T1W624_9STRA|nr:G-box binding factor [Phytophthora pseudosyringae]
MAAVRSVLLSDIQSVLSLARRRHGFLLSATSGQRSNQQSPLAVFQSFSLLRGRLLRSESEWRCLYAAEPPLIDTFSAIFDVFWTDMAELSPVNVVKPFLDVIRHDHASSTVTGAALEAVMNFLRSWPWAEVKDQNGAADALSDIVDAVSHCRFQETGVESDQNVLVLVVHVLHAVVRSPCGASLSDHSMWQLVESLYALSRGNRHDPHITLPLRSTGTNFLHDTVAFIFSNAAIYSDLAPVAEPATASSDPLRPGFGLPCAVKIVGFLCQKLHQKNYVPPPAPDAPATASGNTTSRREVLLSFSLLQRALIACDAELMTGVPSLMLFIKDDLCSAILRYCRLGACAELKIPVVCLELIRLLWSKLRSELKMQVEALFNGVFYHTMHWCLANMDVNSPEFPRGDDVAPPAGGASGQPDEKPVTMVDAASDEFSGDMLSKSRLYNISFEILDCLVDLLAEATLLPDLYVNYDCDGNRCDLTQTLFELLSQVAQQSHVACFESHEETHFLWAQAVGEIALRGMFNALYVVHLRTHPEMPVVSGDSSNGPSDEEMNEDALLVEQDEQFSPADAEEFASAEVLFKKRQRKKFFQHGIQEFNRKPLAGIKYLQQNTFLPTPLDSMSLATFLRSLPQGLNKNAVGVYLGAMGKEVKGFEKTEIHEADTMDFHRDVLTDFVRSCNFEGESIVTALRMFLASFRLPGEAQQIDRILNTFSLQVYEQCRERFLMASVDVAYLLSFSLIMLNTDLHNPNIRSDKKMKLADFIKNNKNYGQEVSKGLDLPDDFLTELYNTIAKDEIKTFEDGGKHGEVTSDRWKDLLNQAESNPRNSRLIVHHPSVHLRSSSTPRGIGIVHGTSSPLAPDAMRTMKQARLTKSASSPANGATALPKSATWEQQDGVDGLAPLYASSGNQYDRHIFELVQQSLVRAFSSVFQQFVVDSQAKDAARGEDLSVGGSYEMHYVPQKSALQLACNGFVLCAAVASHLSLVEHCNSLFIRLCKYTSLLSSDIYPTGYNSRENGIWVYCDNQSAPVATAAVLKLVSTCSLALHSRSWKYFFHVVSGLREFHVLPSRIMYPSDEIKLELMTPDERLEFIDLVYQNKKELERKIALSAQEQDGGNGDAGGFFSGVAWLLSALDSNLGGSAPGSTTPTKSHLSPGFEQYQLSPAELASHTEDLVIEGKTPKLQPSDGDEHDPRGEFGTDQWIRTTLQPYRLEFLMQDVASLPSRALAEVIEALHDETLLVLRGPNEKESQKDRKKSTKLSLSQGGCVLFEHLLSQVISLSGSLFDGGTNDEDGISAILEAHYTQILEFLRPVLLTNHSPSGLTYENACFLLHKSINGLFAWVTRTHSDANGLLLVNFLGTLMEMSGDDELIRPFLTPIMCGLDRYVTLVQPSNLHYSRMDWLTICNLISWSVGMAHAASHGFGLLERLVTEKIWNGDGNEILISDCYTKMTMFAMKARDPHDSWTPSRPIDLLLFMFDTLRPDAPNYVEERLRFLGGMAVVSRHLLLNQIKQELSNDLVVAAIEGLKHMLREHTGTEQSFKPMAWLDVLRYGLIPVGFDLLNGSAPKHSGGAMHFGDDEEETNSPFLYYRRQLPSMNDESSLKRPNEAHVHNDANGPTGRRRRPSTMKDPLALRPHVVVVQLLSLVVCEELTKLQTCAKFPSVWEDVAELLVGLLEYTAMENPPAAGDGAASGEVLIAALERRSVLSAHEEILEHSKGIVRRLAVIQGEETKEPDDAKEQEGAKSEETGDAAERPWQPNVLMQVLEEKCRSNPDLLDQLFSSKDDTGSAGERTPPIEEVDGENVEEENDSDEAS